MKIRKILLVSILLLCCITSTNAKGEVSPMFIYIRTTLAELSINGSSASCIGGVWAYSPNSSCTITMCLQKQNGSSWTNLKTWTGDGSGSATLSETYTISSGTYRVYVSGNVEGEPYSVKSPTKIKE